MKIALIADIHANYAALEALAFELDQWQADLVVVGGDLVNRGPKPRECLEFVQHRRMDSNWVWLRGNHEDYVIEQAQPKALEQTPAREVHRATRWTLGKLVDHGSPANLELLKSMPYQLSLLDPGGKRVNFVHASMTGMRDGIYPEMAEDDLHAKVFTPLDTTPKTSTEWINQPISASQLALLGVGHTHRPLVRQLDGVLVVNAGSAGLPFDGDTRPSYARLFYQHGGWHAKVMRFKYDLEQAERDFYTTDYLEDGGPLVKLVLVELKTARSQLYHWATRYQERALRGEISMHESVERILAQS